MFEDLPDVHIYLDDILVAPTNEEQHALVIRLIVERAIRYNITLNPEKSQFCERKVHFLGRYISINQITADLSTVNMLFQQSRPRSAQALKIIVPALNWYHSFIPGLATLTAPLIMTSAKGPIWTNQKETRLMRI